VRERLAALEQEAGLANSNLAPADGTLVASSEDASSSNGSAARRAAARRSRASNGNSGSGRRSRHRLTGAVRLGGGLMWSEVRR
jgi:hypothetical protein